VYGTLDSGAERIFLKASTAKRLKLMHSVNAQEPTSVIFGNGSSVLTSLAAHLNSHLQALVIPDKHLINDLVGTTPILDLGYDIHLSNKGSYITDDVKTIPIIRQEDRFIVDITQLKCLVATTNNRQKR